MDITPRGFERASDKLTAEQLDRPIDDVVVPPKAEEVAPSESVPEKPIETTPEPVPEPVQPEPVVETEEDKVPKSRFLTMHQRAVEAEKALRAFEAERASQPQVVTPVADDEDLHKFYTETFGQTELAEKLYKNELSRLTSIEEKAAERAYQRLSQKEQVENELIDQRVASFDSAFEELAIAEGKQDFTDDEQVALLDIVEEYSPQDKDGKLIGEFLLPLDKAYEIYKLRHETSAQPKREERNKVASIVGAKTEGTPSASNDADWQPGFQGRWRDRIK